MASRRNDNTDINEAINGFIPDEVNTLEELFKKEPMPTTLDLTSIAAEMRRTLLSIESWFRYRRRQQIREIYRSIGARAESAVPTVQDRSRVDRLDGTANPYRLYYPLSPDRRRTIQPGQLFQQYEGGQMDDSESEDD
ncbi:hypothetical protein ACOME3_006734 [Neoechinorhynchus agilis]